MLKKILYILVFGIFVFNLQPAFCEENVCNQDIIKTKFQNSSSETDYKSVVNLINVCISKKSDNLELYRMRGYAYKSLEVYDKALADYDMVLSLKNNNIDAMWGKSDVLFLQGKTTDSIKVMDEIITLTPKDPIAYYTRGFAKFTVHEYAGAVNDFDLAISLYRNVFEPVYLFRGISYLGIGQYKNSIHDLSYYIKKNINNPRAYYNRGLSYIASTELPKGLDDLFTALALYDNVNDRDGQDTVVTALQYLVEDFPELKDFESELFPDIYKYFENYYRADNLGEYVFYVHPQKWSKMPYKQKITLFQKCVFFAIYKEIEKDKNSTPLYFLSVGDVHIRSSIDGTLLLTYNPGLGKQDKKFSNVTLQKISENAVLTKAYIKSKPKKQDEILNAYLRKVDAQFEDNTYQYQDYSVYRSYIITVDRNGNIKQITLNDAPWQDGIDDEAVKTIKSVAPFPQIPQDYKKDNIEIHTIIMVDAKKITKNLLSKKKTKPKKLKH